MALIMDTSEVPCDPSMVDENGNGLPWGLTDPNGLVDVLKKRCEKVLVIDSRSFLEFNTSHIQQSVNVCCSKLVKRHLQQDKVHVRDLLAQTCHVDIDESWNVIVYDQCTEDPSLFTEDNFVFVLLRKLAHFFNSVTFLKGGFLAFQAVHPSLCENESACLYKCVPLTSLSQPCLPVSNIGPTRILPFLYLGSQRDALSQETIQVNGINYVLNLSNNCGRAPFVQDGHFLRIPVNDNYSEQLLPYFYQAFQFIDKVREANGCVLVHCLAGISRSPTVAIAYIMNHMKMSSDDAYRYVKDKRPTISPNFNFLGQLLDFEKQLRQGSTNRAKVSSESAAKTKEHRATPFVMDLQLCSPSSPVTKTTRSPVGSEPGFPCGENPIIRKRAALPCMEDPFLTQSGFLCGDNPVIRKRAALTCMADPVLAQSSFPCGDSATITGKGASFHCGDNPIVRRKRGAFPCANRTLRGFPCGDGTDSSSIREFPGSKVTAFDSGGDTVSPCGDGAISGVETGFPSGCSTISNAGSGTIGDLVTGFPSGSTTCGDLVTGFPSGSTTCGDLVTGFPSGNSTGVDSAAGFPSGNNPVAGFQSGTRTCINSVAGFPSGNRTCVNPVACFPIRGSVFGFPCSSGTLTDKAVTLHAATETIPEVTAAAENSEDQDMDMMDILGKNASATMDSRTSEEDTCLKQQITSQSDSAESVQTSDCLIMRRKVCQPYSLSLGVQTEPVQNDVFKSFTKDHMVLETKIVHVKKDFSHNLSPVVSASPTFPSPSPQTRPVSIGSFKSPVKWSSSPNRPTSLEGLSLPSSENTTPLTPNRLYSLFGKASLSECSTPVSKAGHLRLPGSSSSGSLFSLQSPTSAMAKLNFSQTLMEQMETVTMENDFKLHNFPATSLDKLNFTPCFASDETPVRQKNGATKRPISSTSTDSKSSEPASPMSISSVSSTSSTSVPSPITKVMLRSKKPASRNSPSHSSSSSVSETKSTEPSSPMSICSSSSGSSVTSPTSTASKVILRSRENKAKRSLVRPNSIAFSTYPTCDLGSDCQDSSMSGTASQDDASEAYMMQNSKKSKQEETVINSLSESEKKFRWGKYSEREVYKQITAAMNSAMLRTKVYEASRRARSLDDILNSEEGTSSTGDCECMMFGKIPRRCSPGDRFNSPASIFEHLPCRCRGSSDPYQSNSSISSSGSHSSLHGSLEIIQLSNLAPTRNPQSRKRLPHR